MKSLDDKMNHRWVVCIGKQKTIWASPEVMPEVAISSETVLESFSRKSVAESFVDSYLAELDAKATWSDVRPIETCSMCGCDFDTRHTHNFIGLTEESGPEENPVLHYAWYPARFCANCEPV